jgi:beta-phosphoglucomutase-like phosphatase (HAD superfamily)
MRSRNLRSRPAPDLLLAACDELGVRPDEAVTLTHSGAGVVAGAAAGLGVVGVAAGAQEQRLLDFGSPRVVPSLGTLLDGRLRER